MGEGWGWGWGGSELLRILVNNILGPFSLIFVFATAQISSLFRSRCRPFDRKNRRQADEMKRVAQAAGRGAVPSFGEAGEAGGGGGGGSQGTGPGGARGSAHDASRREASVVLVDRTLDLAAAASRGGSLLQRVRHGQTWGA